MNYFKELAAMRIDPIKDKGTGSLKFKDKQSFFNPFIDVKFFSVTDGFDPATTKMFNDRLEQVKAQFENQMKELGTENYEIKTKLVAYDKQGMTNQMTTAELMTLIFLKQ